MGKQTKFLLTGGHAATPALAVLEEIKERGLDWDIYWIGPRFAMEGVAVKTAAEEVLGSHGVKIAKIIAGRRKTRGSFSSRITAHIKIPIGFIHAFWYVAKIRPKAVLSFGGFAAVPVVFSAWLLGIPVIIHEQVVGAGLGNKLSSPFARKILVARSESLEIYPKQKTVLVGNPQVSAIFQIKPKDKIGSPVTLFVTGGSTGAETINNVIDKILESLLVRYKIIHQAGQNNLKYFLDRKEKLSKNLAPNYEVFGYKLPQDIAKCFSAADIIISRAGANTVSDIVVSRRPSILIPIPWSINNEQHKNALKAVEAGVAVILEQDKLTPESLYEKIMLLENDWVNFTKVHKSSDYDLDKTAAIKIVDQILYYIQ